MPGTSWTTTKTLVSATYNPDYVDKFVCGSDSGFNQYCYWKGTTCNLLDLSANFTFTLGDYNFTIPLENIASNTTYNGRVDCDLYLTQLKNTTENMIRLGDPFFSSFLPVFNVDKDMLGLALSARSYPGSAMVKIESVDP